MSADPTNTDNTNWVNLHTITAVDPNCPNRQAVLLNRLAESKLKAKQNAPNSSGQESTTNARMIAGSGFSKKMVGAVKLAAERHVYIRKDQSTSSSTSTSSRSSSSSKSKSSSSSSSSSRSNHRHKPSRRVRRSKKSSSSSSFKPASPPPSAPAPLRVQVEYIKQIEDPRPKPRRRRADRKPIATELTEYQPTQITGKNVSITMENKARDSWWSWLKVCF